MTKPRVIFFGNGPLADVAFDVLNKHCEIIFCAKSREDLETVKELFHANAQSKTSPIFGVLASFGVLIKSDVLELFEPTGILNIHPSLLPKYRGPSPIETAIFNGDTKFGVSIMKLVPAMDAGPIYHQQSFEFTLDTQKSDIYQTLASSAATWLVDHLSDIHSGVIQPAAQDNSLATYTKKLDKSLSPLDPTKRTATELNNQIRAFANFPKSKYGFFGLDCTIIKAHVATAEEEKNCIDNAHTLSIQCHDNSLLIIDEIQPAGRKVMDAKSFLNGYKK